MNKILSYPRITSDSTKRLIDKVKNREIFNPNSKIVWEPPKDEYIDVFFESMSGNMLHAWLFDLYDDRPIILYCHGNFGNITYRQKFVELAKILRCNIFMFDYSGYGESEGEPSLINLRLDSLSAYQYVEQYYHPHDIFIFGKSLGGYSALTIASEYPDIMGVIVCSTFSTFDMVIEDTSIKSKIYRFLIRMCTSEVPSNRELIKKASRNNTRVSIMHSAEDSFIPYRNGIDLKNTCGVTCSFVEIQGDHASPSISLDEFLKSLDFIDFPFESRDYQFIQELSDWLDTLPEIHKLLDI